MDEAEASYSRAVAERVSAEASVLQAEANLKSVEVDLSRAIIRSPVDGIVLSKDIEAGQTVAASYSTPELFTIAEDLKKMELHVNVDEADIGQVQEGQKVTFTVDAHPGKIFNGMIIQTRYGATTTDNVVTYETVIQVDNSNLMLRPGMTRYCGYCGQRDYRDDKNSESGHEVQAAGHEPGEEIVVKPHPAGTTASQQRETAGYAGSGRCDCLGAKRWNAGTGECDSGGNRWQIRAGCERGYSSRRLAGDRHADGQITMEPQQEPLIRLVGVKKIYGMGTTEMQALRGVDLTINEGEFVAVMGPSGSGKSTCMNILGCLDTPTKGSYQFKGVEVGSLDRSQRARLRRFYIGFVFQGFNLLSRTSALENVELPLLYRGIASKQRKEMGIRALDQVGLKGWEKHTPSELSGGQQQRVAIARAIASSPNVLFADEPTGNLDSARSVEIMELLMNLNRQNGITVVMVTHEPDMAEYARRIIRFKDGLVDEDSPGGGVSS